MPSDLTRLRRLANHVLSTWNTQDVERVLACYTDDLVYLDPNTQGPVRGREAMRSYLTKLFSRWTMTWEGGDLFPLEGTDGVAIRWTGSLSPAGDTRSVEISGLDLVILDGELVKRNEVYFDRAPLASLLAPAAA
jgi:ketosteroid isomerase-like protein